MTQNTQNTPNNSYIFSKVSASQILNCDVRNISKVDFESTEEVLVYLANSERIHEVKTMEFYKLFVKKRRAKSKELLAEQVNELMVRVSSENSAADSYLVTFWGGDITCECKDYEIQKSLGISQPCCKHIYKALDKMGYDSAKEYKKTWLELQEYEINYEHYNLI